MMRRLPRCGTCAAPPVTVTRGCRGDWRTGNGARPEQWNVCFVHLDAYNVARVPSVRIVPSAACRTEGAPT